MIYQFEKQTVNLDQLKTEIEESAITRNLDYLSHTGSTLTVVFLANLLGSDEVILTALVNAHVALFSYQVQQVEMVSPNKLFLNIVGNSTTVVKSGAGKLHGIVINNNACNGSVTIYDNTAASGTKIATMATGSPSGGLLSTSGLPGPNGVPMGLNFNTGLTVVTAGSNSNNITVFYE